MDLTLTARGADAEKAAQAVKEFNGHLAEGRQETAKMAERMPAMKPLADFVASVKATADGADATVTARMTGDPKALLGIPAMMWRVTTIEVHPAQADPAPVPAP